MSYKRVPVLTGFEAKNIENMGYMDSNKYDRGISFSLKRPYSYHKSYVDATIKIGDKTYVRMLNRSSLDKDFKDLLETARNDSNSYFNVEPYMVLDITEKDSLRKISYIDSYEVDSGSDQPVVVFGLGVNSHTSFNFFPQANTGILSSVEIPLYNSVLTESDGLILVRYHNSIYIYDASLSDGIPTDPFIRSLTEERLKEIFYPIRNRGYLDNV